MFTHKNRDELETCGVTVVEGVVSLEDCDRHQAYFREWLNFFEEWPQSRNSLIQRYSSGHLQAAWEVRLAAKPTFTQVWGTQKLLTSMDAIAIGRPPEGGEEDFWSPNDNWLHVDQAADRVGLHAYQGAVYLEETAEDDWTFEVVGGSHKHFDEFMSRTDQWRCRQLKDRDIAWFKSRGCHRRRVPCPKGGMVLWDSRLFHANARPIRGRQNKDRWRFVVFVCMAPAAWASESDLDIKRKAYKEMKLTTHWPSQEVCMFSSRINKGQSRGPEEMQTLPEIATTKTAQQLAGLIPYDDDEDDRESVETVGETACATFWPVWNKEKWAMHIERFKNNNPKNKGPNNRRKAAYKA